MRSSHALHARCSTKMSKTGQSPGPPASHRAPNPRPDPGQPSACRRPSRARTTLRTNRGGWRMAVLLLRTIGGRSAMRSMVGLANRLCYNLIAARPCPTGPVSLWNCDIPFGGVIACWRVQRTYAGRHLRANPDGVMLASNELTGPPAAALDWPHRMSRRWCIHPGLGLRLYPEPGGGEGDGAEVVSRELVGACRELPEVLEAVEAALDEVALAVEVRRDRTLDLLLLGCGVCGRAPAVAMVSSTSV
jgi:hypothetical protein